MPAPRSRFLILIAANSHPDCRATDAAAIASRTIRYQRECARRYVADAKGELVHEIAFMDTRPDRATDAVMDELKRSASAYSGTGAAVLVVSFEEVHLWRRNPYMPEAARQLRLELIQLPPDSIIIDGKLFDPVRHFKEWRTRDASAMTRLRLEAMEGLHTALVDTPAGDGRWRKIADRLNSGRIRTIRGGDWTAENVRKLAGRLQRDGSQMVGESSEEEPSGRR
jgi:hypothetical protein